MNVATLVPASAISLVGTPDAGRRGCMVHDHQALQVRRMPITPATTSKPRNPLKDEAVHCEGSRGVPLPHRDRTGSEGRR